jgi:hypothetical protein
LTDNANGDFLSWLYGEWTAFVPVGVGECFFVDVDLECLFGFLLCRGNREIAQAFSPVIEFVFVATAEEDLANDEVGAVVVVIEHPIIDVVNVTAFHFIANRIVDVEADDLDRPVAGIGDSGRGSSMRRLAGVTDPGYNIQSNVGFTNGDEAGS